MIAVRVRFEEWGRFWDVFTTAGAERRREHGSQGVRVFRDADDPAVALLLFDWEREAFEAFRADPDVQATMRSGGATGPPEATFLEPVATLDA
jgi:quinol monooxygenase YgiN